MDWILTGASRGIGAALLRALLRRSAREDRFFVLARDVETMALMAREENAAATVMPLALDLTRREQAREVGRALARDVRPGATLIHNSGLWPSRREEVDGLEAAFLVNCLSPLELQRPLLDQKKLGRILVISAGLLVKGRFHAERTPSGSDFSALRTYCTTKLAGAIAMRAVARAHPEVDLAVVHPGVVQTALGDRSGLLGWLLRRIKRRWESPERCAERLVALLDEPRWQSSPGLAPWYIEATPSPWPEAVDRDASAVDTALRRLLAG